jgi:sec-independent protein translocase protein TatA
MLNNLLSPGHLLLILLVVVLIFGTKKLRNLGSDLGSAVKGFKDGMNGTDDESVKQISKEGGQVVDDGVKDKNHTGV